jgi:hypothetical protein
MGSSVSCRIDGLAQRQCQFDFVDEAPAPVFPGLKGRNDRMCGALEMLAGVTIFRIITTSDMAAAAAQAQMHPGIAAR